MCADCYEQHYDTCEECGEIYRNDELYEVRDQFGSAIHVCEDCRDEYYRECEECRGYVHDSLVNRICTSSGELRYVCDDCLAEKYTECDNCGEYYLNDMIVDGHCPNCCESEIEIEIATEEIA